MLIWMIFASRVMYSRVIACEPRKIGSFIAILALGLVQLLSSFSGEWRSMGGLPGVGSVNYFCTDATTGKSTSCDAVCALVIDDSGNLYAGGDFTIIGDVITTAIAKWDGTNWMPLGSGLWGGVNA